MPTSRDFEGVVLGLDVGDARIGVARAHTIAKLPEALSVIDNNDNAIHHIQQLSEAHEAVLFVIGLPLLASGHDSDQTRKVREFAEILHAQTRIPYVFVDESFSSKQADDIIREEKQTLRSNDAFAACIIVERYFTEGAL